ncbi:MAG: hypothetical protein CMM33_10525 [Rhodospirillaceae bacterium]|nr:hypothetical protein [Rhodospirillaceae bacterium]
MAHLASDYVIARTAIEGVILKTATEEIIALSQIPDNTLEIPATGTDGEVPSVDCDIARTQLVRCHTFDQHSTGTTVINQRATFGAGD